MFNYNMYFLYKVTYHDRDEGTVTYSTYWETETKREASLVSPAQATLKVD